MEKPDQRLLEEDLSSAEFRTGVVKEFWDLAGAEVVPEGLAWPTRVFWMAAAARANAPARFFVLLDLSGYRSVSPTGTFWDPTTKSTLDLSKRPKGKPDSRFAKVFRTDWESGLAFYHPYDRVAATTRICACCSSGAWSMKKLTLKAFAQKDSPSLIYRAKRTSRQRGKP